MLTSRLSSSLLTLGSRSQAASSLTGVPSFIGIQSTCQKAAALDATTSRCALRFKRSIRMNTSSTRHFSSGTKREGQTTTQRFLGHKEMPPRWTVRWYGEMVLLCTVFAITGSSTMVLVRPAMTRGLGLKGSLKEGPWSYRICSIVIMTPLYASLLVVVGTVFGRHFYFKHFAVKMFSRFGIPPELMDKNFQQTAKNFRKY